ncbi:hypothetical protein [Niallia endozanthoxylica]|nr:hypothetical protein [Niallia endozanthoxylica]
MDKNQYNFANLSSSDLEQVNSLQKSLSEKKGEEVILIAYEDHKNK